MREVGHDGQTYITVTSIRHQDGYTDVTPGILRGWVHAGHLHVVTVAELAAAFARAVPAGVDPDGPARAPGPSGSENVYRWADVVRCETARRVRRRTHGGRARTDPTRHLPPAA